MRILSSSKLSARNSDLSTGVKTRLSFSYGKLLGWSQNKYLVFPFLITYRKIVSSWKRHKISAWHEQNLNVIKTIRNWKKEQKRLELKSMTVIEIRTKWNTKQIEGSLKLLFSGTFFLNAGISGTTMKPTLLQKILKEVTYSSIF